MQSSGLSEQFTEMSKDSDPTDDTIIDLEKALQVLFLERHTDRLEPSMCGSYRTDYYTSLN